MTFGELGIINSDVESIRVKVIHKDHFETLELSVEELQELLKSKTFNVPKTFYKGGCGYNITASTDLNDLKGSFISLVAK